MQLALGTAAVVLVVLVWELCRPHLVGAVARERARLRARRWRDVDNYDPGRERRAERRARALLRSCVDERDWLIYRDLGFLRVWGTLPDGGRTAGGARGQGAAYAYLIYPHKPIVAYLPATGELLNEYCVEFPDNTRPYGSPQLPDSDDVLAKWMALTADERSLIGEANMHLPGRQVDPDRVRRDLQRLIAWERAEPPRVEGQPTA
jgi:hypothetical protein